MQRKLNIFEFFYNKPVLILITSAVIFVIGFLFSDIPTMIVSQGWPATDGTITSNRIVGQKIKQFDGSYYTDFEVYIRYQYSVNGFSYSSTSVNSIDSPSYPANIADRYPYGRDVIVYYNPRDPSKAVLEPGFINIFKAFDVFSYLIFGVGIYFIYLGISRIIEIRGRNREKI